MGTGYNINNMRARLVKVGNSHGVLLPKSLIRYYNFAGEVEIEQTEKGLVITPVRKPARADWDARFKQAVAEGHEPENDMFEGLGNDFDNQEWQW